MNAHPLTFLRDIHNHDGGWGYGTGQSSTVEATAAVALALQDEPDAAELHEQALAWLRAVQNEDGGWGLSQADDESNWHTAWALLALVRSGGGSDAGRRGVAWLMQVDLLVLDNDEMQNEARETLSIDSSLRGWPWLPGQATWVEPTALAMLALAAVPTTRPIRDRLDEAARYLVDRRCRGGGWNVGNPVMLGAFLPPRAHQTALALLALAKITPDAIQPQDRAALRSEMERDGGVLALALGVWALKSLGEDETQARARLEELRETDGGWNANAFHTAVAMIALKERV